MIRLGFITVATVLSFACARADNAPAYRYFRAGNASDAQASPRAGYALMGGGTDQDAAFKFLCDHAPGGDLLVLRATGGDDYNPYLQKLCSLNSVATVVIPSRAAAADPFVAQAIARASALFIAGGDQANYINFWQATPVQSALNNAIRRGVPVGGTSAGLAVLGEWAYTAQGDKPDDPNLDAKLALADPFGPRITLGHNFVEIPLLKGILTDSHFARRNRMGRLLAFLARLKQPDGKPVPPGSQNVRGIGIDERAAVLVEPDGSAQVVGTGAGAWFIDAQGASGMMVGGKLGVMALKKPLTFGPFDVQHVAPGHSFNLLAWTGESTRYTLSVASGSLRSTQAGDKVY